MKCLLKLCSKIAPMIVCEHVIAEAVSRPTTNFLVIPRNRDVRFPPFIFRQAISSHSSIIVFYEFYLVWYVMYVLLLYLSLFSLSPGIYTNTPILYLIISTKLMIQRNHLHTFVTQLIAIRYHALSNDFIVMYSHNKLQNISLLYNE
jgi:hypothetical protein